MNILVVDDIIAMVSLLRTSLEKHTHTVFTARDGIQAEEILKKTPIDVVVTDWLMPELDGIGLIHWIRTHIDPIPSIIMVTMLGSAEARIRVLEAGADAYLDKPVQPQQIIDVIDEIKRKNFQRITPSAIETITLLKAKKQEYVGVGIAAGTSGAVAIRTLFQKMGNSSRASYFIILHGPGWAAEALADQIQMETPLPVVIPEDGEAVERGTIYVAPGDKHMVIDAAGHVIRLLSTAPENYLRPSADPLFRSIATAFGNHAIGVVLSGNGCDASVGCGCIKIGGGTVIVQEPAGSVAPQMVQHIIALGLATHVLPLEKIAQEISGHIHIV